MAYHFAKNVLKKMHDVDADANSANACGLRPTKYDDSEKLLSSLALCHFVLTSGIHNQINFCAIISTEWCEEWVF